MLSKEQCVVVALGFTALVKHQIVLGNVPYTTSGVMYKDLWFLKRWMVNLDMLVARWRFSVFRTSVEKDNKISISAEEVIPAIDESGVNSSIWIIKNLRHLPVIAIVINILPSVFSSK